ncbi:MAG: hypothetical protein KU29_04315 [Sulfurovum sp. FS06-10]|nr:MAG: hypothetical protein KU29_04315 [Sulfurovum sp. FS06-10]
MTKIQKTILLFILLILLLICLFSLSNKEVKIQPKNKEIIHIAPIIIPPTPKKDDPTTTLSNLQLALESLDNAEASSVEKSEKVVLTNLKESIEQLTPPKIVVIPKEETPKKSPIKAMMKPIVKPTIIPKTPSPKEQPKNMVVVHKKVEVKEKAVNLPIIEKPIERQQPIIEKQPKEEKYPILEPVASVEDKINEEEIKLNDLSFVKTLGVVKEHDPYTVSEPTGYK